MVESGFFGTSKAERFCYRHKTLHRSGSGMIRVSNDQGV